MKPGRVLFLTSTFVFTVALSVGAQQGITNPTQQTLPVFTKAQERAKPLQKKVRRPRSVIPPVTLLHNPEYLSGEASVTVAANSNPLVRIGMAQNGVTLIELPVADKFFAVHAGNSDLVTVEKSPSLKRDHHLILRAGSGFLVPQPHTKSFLSVLPATSIIMQMDSGMAITLMIYPVPLLRQQAHRLVITYNRDEVILARRTAGLATNLVGPEAVPAAVAISTPEPLTIETTESTGIEPAQKADESASLKPDYKAITETALRDAVANAKSFKKWPAPRHGLSISTLPAREINAAARLVIFAVRNEGSETLRLISGYPDLYIETLNDNYKPVETEARIDKLHLASSSTDNSIPPGVTCYFALAYNAPILGARQHLKVVVAHMSAADEPATADLTAIAK